MEKLSSILPASPRVQSVDMADAHAVRPGVRSYGRPIGANPIKDRLTISQQAKDVAFQETLGTINPREAKSVKIADDMSKKFFETRLTDGIKGRPASEETQERGTDLDSTAPPQPEAIPMQTPTSPAAPGTVAGANLDIEA